MSKLRDVVVVRVSEKGDREDEHFHSLEVQIEAAGRWARDRGERLAGAPIPEIDVSGRLPSKRPGLLAAIEMIEAGRADQLVVAYFDRLVRSLKVQLEVIERVERAGGEILRARSRQAHERDGGAAPVDEHARLGVPILCRDHGREGHGGSGAGGGAGCLSAPEDPGRVRARRERRAGRGARGREGRGAGVQAPRSRPLAGGDPGVAGRERDRARALRCGVDVALADVSGRDPVRRAAQHAGSRGDRQGSRAV